MHTSYRETAAEVLGCVGGSGNILSNTLCMTRLRLVVANPTLIDIDRLNSIAGVLGTAGRGPKGIEVVFGPKRIRNIYDAFCELSGVGEASDGSPDAQDAGSGSLRVHITSKRRIRPDAPGESAEEIKDLARLLTRAEEEAVLADASSLDEDLGPRLLVINGPNINMLGVREPGLYGSSDYAALLELCHKTAKEQGFSDCHCYQSNHEGDLVDTIQDAYQVYDGIIINPGAYTHTSVAILDALKAVSIPAIEVHISQVSEREDFRQVSYVRLACFETIMGEGIKGYAHAIRDMAKHLDA